MNENTKKKIEFLGPEDENEVYTADGPTVVFKREVPADVPAPLAESLVASGRFRIAIPRRKSGKESES